ncbi:MAG: hemolysin family protein [Coriobacteriia bacterium]|nr:hemolysin family protein [Coriobacteriia bacterium]MCL2749476.1 hemolysin family protein [Coriobacteriia bacterium]
MDSAIIVTVTIILILISGYFSMGELALISARRGILQQFVDGETDRSKKASRALDLAQRSDRLLATTQVAITIVGLLAASFAAVSFSEPLANWLSGFGLSWLAVAAPILGIIITTLIVSYVTLILGELLPKRIALSNAENTAMRVSGTIRFFERLLSPVVTFLAASTNVLARLFRIKKQVDSTDLAEEEIKIMVSEQDSLLDEEKRMITEIFDLGDTVALEIMTPRVDMVCVDTTQSVSEAVALMRKTGLSRLPVIQDTRDKVLGVVMLKDLLEPLLGSLLDESVSRYMRVAVFVPETKSILPLLSEMQTTKMQVAIVVDEYGGTAGLVSIEDIIEEIVGDIDDEYDPSTKHLAQLSENIWMIDGRLPVVDAIELGFPLSEGEDYETVAGWMMNELDTLPQKGETLEVEDFTFTVKGVTKNRIAMIRVTKDESKPAE